MSGPIQHQAGDECPLVSGPIETASLGVPKRVVSLVHLGHDATNLQQVGASSEAKGPRLCTGLERFTLA